VGYQWHFEVVGESLEFLLGGLSLTVGLSLLSMAAGLALGMLVSFARLAPWRPLCTIASLYIDFLRGTPLLVQILWIYYSLPILTGVVFSPFVSAAIALTLNLSAFIS
jgi:His/Glu/Gln/Arg/opine family amino acid ABC transporter permease subunit